jgi:hypothetical protein
MPTIEQRIEAFLLEARDWVPGKVLCAQFEINERQLRQVGDQSGLISDFAISSDKGFKHVSKASRTEYLRFKHRLHRHGISELRRVRGLDQRRSNTTKTIKRPAFKFERDNGQGVFL